MSIAFGTREVAVVAPLASSSGEGVADEAKIGTDPSTGQVYESILPGTGIPKKHNLEFEESFFKSDFTPRYVMGPILKDPSGFD